VDGKQRDTQGEADEGVETGLTARYLAWYFAVAGLTKWTFLRS